MHRNQEPPQPPAGANGLGVLSPRRRWAGRGPGVVSVRTATGQWGGGAEGTGLAGASTARWHVSKRSQHAGLFSRSVHPLQSGHHYEGVLDMQSRSRVRGHLKTTRAGHFLPLLAERTSEKQAALEEARVHVETSTGAAWPARHCEPIQELRMLPASAPAGIRPQNCQDTSSISSQRTAPS